MAWPRSRLLVLAGVVALVGGSALVVLTAAATALSLRPAAASLPITASLGPIQVPAVPAPHVPAPHPATPPPPVVAARPTLVLAPVPAPAWRPPTLPSLGLSDHPCGNHFARGYCTWWAAQHRCVPWFGEAADWLADAARVGYVVSRTPVVGAIAVWGRGEHGASRSGHVGLVSAVHGDGTVEVSEMNWTDGWDRTDDRSVRVTDIRGFILPLTATDPGPPRRRPRR